LFLCEWWWSKVFKWIYIFLAKVWKVKILLSLSRWWKQLLCMSSTRTICVVCLFVGYECHNLSLGLMTKVRPCKGVSQEWSSGVTFHAFDSVGKCEGLNPHTPKWAPTLGVKVSMDPRIFKRRLQGTKLIGLKNSL